MISWLKTLISDLKNKEFTGKIVLNFHKGHLEKRYEARKVEKFSE